MIPVTPNAMGRCAAMHRAHDMQLGAAVMGRLSSHGHPALKRLECQVVDGVVVLRGVVASYYHKQLAQEAVRTLEALRGITNLIHVDEARASPYMD